VRRNEESLKEKKLKVVLRGVPMELARPDPPKSFLFNAAHPSLPRLQLLALTIFLAFPSRLAHSLRQSLLKRSTRKLKLFPAPFHWNNQSIP
jgi:hypothetical protein